MNPGGPKSSAGTPYSVGEFIEMETEALIAEKDTGKRKQEALKALVRCQVVFNGLLMC